MEVSRRVAFYRYVYLVILYTNNTSLFTLPKNLLPNVAQRILYTLQTPHFSRMRKIGGSRTHGGKKKQFCYCWRHDFSLFSSQNHCVLAQEKTCEKDIGSREAKRILRACCRKWYRGKLPLPRNWVYSV